jgi:hypothetical protein
VTNVVGMTSPTIYHAAQVWLADFDGDGATTMNEADRDPGTRAVADLRRPTITATVITLGVYGDRSGRGAAWTPHQGPAK